MDTELLIYQIVGFAFLICRPVALAFIILPAPSLLTKRLRWGVVAFIGLGCMFVGFVASWPGPKTVTGGVLLS